MDEAVLRSLLIVAGLMAASLVVGLILRFVLDWLAQRKTGDTLLVTLIRTFKTQVVLWCLAIGAAIDPLIATVLVSPPSFEGSAPRLRF